ncbi:FAD-dependent oxidoreductase [Amycolatopsis sp. FU40]|uniref:flavin monoamine oxidase family protein n=1 Tax=Amycolatopsis sp. FU40 TaxID=2914159 RepID=UPI001F1F3556|nr:FAD-dependent oxidoreductase [Amycolatopsis sp. FU40]UKD58065.1 FAD-dependent oxidoreductase [Amycolatopsis sp. FU40]
MAGSVLPPGVSRRRFLSAVGTAGGAGAMFATMGALGLAPTAHASPRYEPPRRSDFALTGRGAAKVVVLGGGIAGLAAAYELTKGGYDCTVLEAADRPGGRNFTARGGTVQTDLRGDTQTAAFSEGIYLNAGPARIAQWMVTLDYCRELGVPVEVFTNTNASAFVYNEAAGMRQPERIRTTKADVYGYVSELLAKATDRGALDSELTATDKERLLDFLRDWGAIGNKASGWRYAGTSRRGYSTDPGAGDQAGVPLGPVPSLARTLAEGAGRYLSFDFAYEQAMLMFQPVGGMDRIPLALARALGPRRLRLRTAVTGITNTADKVGVAFLEPNGTQGHLVADFCVAALPPRVLARIPHNLGPEIQAALGKWQIGTAAKIGLEYRSRWWETDCRIYGGITHTDLDIERIWYPSHGFHGPRGLLVNYCYGNHARQYGDLAPDARAQRAVEQGVKIHGGKHRTELASAFSVAWHLMPHIESAWATPPLGTPAYQLLGKPAGRVYFAGDWLTHLTAWQAGAFESARLAVRRLHERVLSP